MNLDFVDPPIPSDWKRFEPRIGPDRAASALKGEAASIREDELMASWDEFVVLATEALEDPAIADVYASGVPMIARFLTVELETEHKIDTGIGRVAPGDPPPRYGEIYGKRLRSGDALDRISSAIETLILRGFATGAARNNLATEPARIQNRPLQTAGG